MVVNNAGFVRDRMFVSCGEEEWDAVLRVHLKGHFCTARHACAHWRGESKAGRPVDARIINTSSGAGLQGSVGQSAYSAAKGGIAALTLVQAAELGALRHHRQRHRAVGPHAHDRGGLRRDDGRSRTRASTRWTRPTWRRLVVWLVQRGVARGERPGLRGGGGQPLDRRRLAQTGPAVERDRRWNPDEVGPAVAELLRKGEAPQKVYGT